VTVGSAFESPTVVSGLDDVAVVGQAIEQRRRHLGITEDARPFAEGEIGGDDWRNATRYDRLGRNYLASLCLVAALVWWI
jgi:hypothetical protein